VISVFSQGRQVDSAADLLAMLDVVCLWDHPLSKRDIDRLIESNGDCIAAGIPCVKHRTKKDVALHTSDTKLEGIQLEGIPARSP
jgi:hypothetical protein